MTNRRPPGYPPPNNRRHGGGHVDVTRLVDRPSGQAGAEDRLASLLRQTEPSRGLDPGMRARVLSRLTAPTRRWIPSPTWRWGLVALVLCSSGVVVAAAGLGRWWRPSETTAIATGPTSAATKRSARVRSQPAVMPDETAGAASAAEQKTATGPAEQELPAAPGTTATATAADQPTSATPATPAKAATIPTPAAGPAAPTSRTGREDSRPPSKLRLASKQPVAGTVSRTFLAPSSAMPMAERPILAPEERPAIEPRPFPAPSVVSPPRRLLAPTPGAVMLPTPGPLSAEAHLIKRALIQLRRDQDAEGALAQLDVYLRRFPAGALRHEANIARVDALLSLNRTPDALAALDRLILGPRGRDQELQVIRGELRGELQSTGGCGGAIADFTQVLNSRAPGPLAERALYGRAACRLRRGDTPGGTRDLATYLSRFPAGRFASEARAALPPAGK